MNVGSDSVTKKRKEREKEQRRQAILEAALELFVEHGYRRTTIDMIAEKTELSKGLVYFYFSSKDEILSQIIKDALTLLIRQLEFSISWTQNPVEQLKQYIRTELEFYAKNRPLAKLLHSLFGGYELQAIRESYQQTFRELHAQEFQILREILERGIQEGAFRPGPVDLYMTFIAGPIHSLVLFGKGNFPDPETFSETLVDLFFHGLIGPSQKDPDTKEETTP